MSSGGVGTAEPVGDEAKAPSTDNNDVQEGTESPSEGQEPPEKVENADEDTGSPPPQSQPVQQAAYHPHLTPGAGYYSGYGLSQMTPEPPSPAGHGGTGGYDVASFLQQQAALAQSNPFGGGMHYGIPQPPLSPSSSGRNMGVIPPASPLFPRATSNSALEQQHPIDSSALHRMAAPPSPSVYLSPPLGPSSGSAYGGMYNYGGAGGGYSAANGTGGNSNNSPEETTTTWAERAQQQNNVQASPQVNPQGVPVQYGRASAGNRAYSFEEMLPPSMLDHQEQQSPVTYSPYGATQTTSSGTLFAHQPWGYSPTSDLYAVPGSPLQPRPNPSAHHVAGHFHGGQMRPMFPGQQPGMPPYYPASSPGPPIQTTASNKGPDGANLFIFHIPNHFTNLDMYHLFCQYGNLLSVRIMVEKDTGRSRGFGFVSYDSPESAAMAIKELNGFAIGNKRLKVQHKQIRATDRQPDHSTLPDSLPPSNRWYDSQRPTQQAPPQDSSEAHVDESGGQGLGPQGEIPAPTSAGANDTANAGVDIPRAPGSGGVDLSLAATGGSKMSPLGNLDQMRNALPDVSES